MVERSWEEEVEVVLEFQRLSEWLETKLGGRREDGN